MPSVVIIPPIPSRRTTRAGAKSDHRTIRSASGSVTGSAIGGVHADDTVDNNPPVRGRADTAVIGAVLRRQERRRLLGVLFDLPLPVTGDRGFTHAEATAGGVPLDEIDIKTMASRRCPGLYLCGEILDVDGRIGGFSFQWAWATGHIAGASASAAAAVVNDRPT